MGPSVGSPEYSRALHPPRGWAPGGVIVVPGYRGKKMRIAARRALAVVRDVAVDGEEVLLSLRAAPGRQLPDAYVHLRRLDASEGVTVRLEHHGAEGIARIPAATLDVTSRSLAERQWRLWIAAARDDDPADAAQLVDGLVTAAAAAEREAPRVLTVTGRHVGPLDVDPEPGPGRARLHGRLVQLRERGVTGAMLVDGPSRPELTDFVFTPAGLELHGDTGGIDLDRLVLLSRADRLELPLEISGDSWRALVPATGAPGHASLRWLRPGRWTVVAATPGETDPELGVHVSAAAEAHLADQGGDQVAVVLRTSPSHELGLVANGGGSWRDRGAFNQKVARKVHYRVARRLPLTDTVFFEAWKGRQYSDNPRAIHEELVRRGDERRIVWAVEHHGVEVPQGVETVIVGSRAVLPHPGPGPLGGQQRLDVQALRQARGLRLRPDVARHPPQADRLRHREPPDGEQELPHPVRQGGRQVGRPGVPERVLHRDLPAGLPLRRPGPRDRVPPQRRLPPAARTGRRAPPPPRSGSASSRGSGSSSTPRPGATTSTTSRAATSSR